MNLTEFQGTTLLIPTLSPTLIALLNGACAGIGLRFMPLCADSPRARAYAAQFAQHDLCHTAAVCGGQLAAALSENKIPLPAMCLMPDAGWGCRLSKSAPKLAALLQNYGLPVIPVRSAAQTLRQIDGLLTSPSLMIRTVSAVCLADALDLLTAQARALAVRPTEADALCQVWTTQLAQSLPASPLRLRAAMRRVWKPMLEAFCALETKPEAPAYLGLGGEPFLRMSEALNCGLQSALIAYGFVPVFGGLSDDLLSRLKSFPQSHPNAGKTTLLGLRTAQGYFAELRADWCNAVNETDCFLAPLPAPLSDSPFAGTVTTMAQCGVTELLCLRTEHCTASPQPNLFAIREVYPDIKCNLLTIPASCTPPILDKKLRLLFPDRAPEPTA